MSFFVMYVIVFFFKQKTAYEMRISDWSSDVCSSDLDGYAESDPALSSSLAYADQSFDSLIGSIGWQASYAINDHLVPYARFTYDHALEDGDEQVFASAQSIPGTMEYAVPGLTYDRNYPTNVIRARDRKSTHLNHSN